MAKEIFNKIHSEVIGVVTTTRSRAAEILRPINYNEVPDATIERGWGLDQNLRDWRQAADVFHTIYTDESLDTKDRLEAQIGLAQMAINLGHYDEAERVLLSHENVLGDRLSKDREAEIHEARVAQKMAWVNVAQHSFKRALSLLDNAQSLVGNIDKPTVKEAELIADIYHWRGNVLSALAARGENKEDNLQKAQNSYESALNWLGRIREKRPGYKNDVIAYNWTRLARVYQMQKLETPMLRGIAVARHYFGEHIKDGHPDAQDLLAHCDILEGIRLMHFHKNSREARLMFEKAYKMRKVYSPQNNAGASEALLGIAWTYWSEFNLPAGSWYALKALKTNPQILLIFRA